MLIFTVLRIDLLKVNIYARNMEKCLKTCIEETAIAQIFHSAADIYLEKVMSDFVHYLQSISNEEI